MVGLVASCQLCRGLAAELCYVCARLHHIALGLVLYYFYDDFTSAPVSPGRGAWASEVWGVLGGVLPEGPLAARAGDLVRLQMALAYMRHS